MSNAHTSDQFNIVIKNLFILIPVVRLRSIYRFWVGPELMVEFLEQRFNKVETDLVFVTLQE